MESAYIIAIAVVVALIILFVMFRFGISFFQGGFRAKHGDSEIEGNAEIRGAREGRQAGTVVKGTKMIGKKQKMRVAKNDARVEDTVMKGEEQEFIVEEGDDREDKA
ncbi:hypothetical protein [Pseudanabaena sp. ABRG5-3]|uniref:hypothetical protein n=1 Tax=Pseudanabaena sp. ABRG5-3 TaxID=685565 RepID=UPI000DC6EEDB|nr:hypothetical protein [Pseudanabaena sp. ABRG5-3]BBC22912.1 hypothetical protein ABRG53_0655 [Pseudanabaena sp. ABRG5-3]